MAVGDLFPLVFSLEQLILLGVGKNLLASLDLGASSNQRRPLGNLEVVPYGISILSTMFGLRNRCCSKA